jgi:ribosome maturation factor RimP
MAGFSMKNDSDRNAGVMEKERIERESEPLLTENGFELVDLKVFKQGAKPLLQFFIDRLEGGVTLEDCANMSDKLGAYIDMNNILEDGYILEISSPGMDRVLRKEKDFIKFKGSNVKLKLKRPINNARVYYGKLLGFENGEVLLSDDLRFRVDDIYEARLNPGDDEILKKHK